MEQRKLSDEDKARIEQFLDVPVNRISRKPFRPIYLLIMLVVVISALMVLSKWLASLVGA
jgi:Protein of unknown function (DUF3094)